MRTYALLIILMNVFFTSCNDDKKKQKINDEEYCFFDSIFVNTFSDTLKEFICYKNDIVYKFQKRPAYERLSRHRIDNKGYLYEVLLINTNSISTDEKTECAKLKYSADSVEVSYISNSNTDSINIIIENNTDTIFNNIYQGNRAVVSKKLFQDSSNAITISNYYTEMLMHPEKNKLMKAISSGTIYYPSAKYFLQNPLDTVLVKIKKCLNK